MRQHELQNIQPWINSRHRPEMEPYKSYTRQINWLLDETFRVQNQLDTAISVAMVLGGMLVMILLVGYIMWANNLIVH